MFIAIETNKSKLSRLLKGVRIGTRHYASDSRGRFQSFKNKSCDELLKLLENPAITLDIWDINELIKEFARHDNELSKEVYSKAYRAKEANTQTFAAMIRASAAKNDFNFPKKVLTDFFKICSFENEQHKNIIIEWSNSWFSDLSEKNGAPLPKVEIKAFLNKNQTDFKEIINAVLFLFRKITLNSAANQANNAINLFESMRQQGRGFDLFSYITLFDTLRKSNEEILIPPEEKPKYTYMKVQTFFQECLNLINNGFSQFQYSGLNEIPILDGKITREKLKGIESRLYNSRLEIAVTLNEFQYATILFSTNSSPSPHTYLLMLLWMKKQYIEGRNDNPFLNNPLKTCKGIDMVFKRAIDHQQATSSIVSQVLRIIRTLIYNTRVSGILFDYACEVIEIAYNLNLITTQIISIFFQLVWKHNKYDQAKDFIRNKIGSDELCQFLIDKVAAQKIVEEDSYYHQLFRHQIMSLEPDQADELFISIFHFISKCKEINKTSLSLLIFKLTTIVVNKYYLARYLFEKLKTIADEKMWSYMIEGAIICNQPNDVRDLMGQLSWPENCGMTQAVLTRLFLNPYLISYLYSLI